MSPLSNSSASRLKPLALAVVLAFAGGASVANDATADRAGAWSAPVTVRPDGSLLWPVTNCDDAGSGSLRDAAASARDGDGIDLAGLSCSLISLETGAITLNDVELIGPGANQLEIDGAGNYPDRVFNHASSGGTLLVEGLKISGGKYHSYTGEGGACLRSTGGSVKIYDSMFDNCIAFAAVGTSYTVRGGAIAVYGETQLHASIVTNSQARTDAGFALGGGVYAQGNLFVLDSTIANNLVSASGSSAYVSGGGVFTAQWSYITHSTIDGNGADGAGVGGGVLQCCGVIRDSTVSNNFSNGGGASGIAIYGIGTVPHEASAVTNSTFSGNYTSASTLYRSGGLYINSPCAVIQNSTITNNGESNLGDIRQGAGLLFGPGVDGAYPYCLVLQSVIVSGNFLHDSDTNRSYDSDIVGPFGAAIFGDSNLIGWSLLPLPADTLVASDPGLGPLQANGGPTWTHLPLPGSPAIDTGSNPEGLNFDQRGYVRVDGNAPDIGSVETQDTIFVNGFELQQ